MCTCLKYRILFESIIDRTGNVYYGRVKIKNKKWNFSKIIEIFDFLRPHRYGNWEVF